ncbi:hypothetical protein GOV07_00900, partial [Candidatus Woesearchaeota archaeon]|nr:hypothetical protein [Candidatus Woesearchaeota archaeon]
MSQEVWNRVDGARILSIIALCMLFVPAVNAAILTLEVVADDTPVVWVNPARPFNAELRFTTDWQSGIITFDLAELGAGSKSINLNTCEQNVTTSCRISGLRVSGSEAVTIPYSYAVSGARREGEYSLSFQLDESTPRVIGLETALCDDRRCYIGDGRPSIITVELADETGAFARHNVYWRFGSQTFRAEECVGMTCTGTTTIGCSDRQSFRLEATTETRDDAGNPASLGNATEVVCDARAPELLSLTYEGTSLHGLVSNVGKLLIKAKVRDASGARITAFTFPVQRNVSENTTVSSLCVANETIHDCLLEIDNLQDGRNKRVTITIEDFVGNAYNKTLVIPHILKVANTSVVPDFFSAKADTTVPESVNRVALQLALDNAIEYPQYISYTITRKNPQARILYQEAEAGSCQVLNEPSAGDPFSPISGNWTAARALYNSFSVYDPYASWEEPNRVDATFLSL